MTELTCGFIPLTDCASVGMAHEPGLYKKYGLNVTVSKEASWAAVRDKLIHGELDAAHVLYGLVYGLHLGTSGPQKDMAVLMNLNHNGQAISLSNQLKDKGVRDGASRKKIVGAEPREYTFAQTFPTGTHAMWLYYWLAANGIHPFKDVTTIVVPPPQMVANMRGGAMDGFCVGEPWNARAIFDKIGFTVTTTQEIWKGHPEKVLGTTAEFVQKYPNTTRALLMAVMEASMHIDTVANRSAVAKIIASKSYVNAPEAVIEGRFLGRYDNGVGKQWQDPDYMKFYNDGAVNFPYLSDGMWFLTQHRRWGLLATDPDYLAVAKQVNQIELYKQAASQLKVPVPKDVMRTAKLIDGVTWDAKSPAQYAASFKIKACGGEDEFVRNEIAVRRDRATRAGRDESRDHYPALLTGRAAADLAPSTRRTLGDTFGLAAGLGVDPVRAAVGAREQGQRRLARPVYHVDRRGRIVQSSLLRQRAQRSRHRLEHPALAATRGHGLRYGGAARHPARLHDRPLRLFQRHDRAHHLVAAARVAARVAAHRPAGVQGGAAGGGGGGLHLQHLAHDHQYGGGGYQGAAGLQERRACAQSCLLF